MNESEVKKVSFYSDALGKEVASMVYLPEGYDSTSPLPVLYFLHGRSGDENIMLHLGINSIADRLISDGLIRPIIIVCPAMDNSRGINSSLVYKEVPESDNSNRIINLGMYEDCFIKEVVPFIDNSFNTIKNRTGRFVGGASAGGYTALHNAFRHQDMFSKVGGHMPALELTLEDEDKAYFSDLASWDKYDPIDIARSNSIASDLEVYLDAGDKDEGGFYEGCSILHKILKDKGITSQNYVFPGHHNPEYILSNIEKYLLFYACL